MNKEELKNRLNFITWDIGESSTEDDRKKKEMLYKDEINEILNKLNNGNT